MLNSGKKICALRDKKINILTLMLSEKKFLNKEKNHNPPLQVKWSVPKFYSRSVGKALESDILTSSRWVREGIDKIILNEWTPVALGSYKINKSDVQVFKYVNLSELVVVV